MRLPLCLTLLNGICACIYQKRSVNTKTKRCGEQYASCVINKCNSCSRWRDKSVDHGLGDPHRTVATLYRAWPISSTFRLATVRDRLWIVSKISFEFAYWLVKKLVKHRDWLIGKSSTENIMSRENYKDDSWVANQNPAVPMINQSESVILVTIPKGIAEQWP